MTLNLVLNKNGVEEKIKVEGIYSISEAYQRLYFHWYEPNKNSTTGVDIESHNLPLSEIVDITIDLVR